MFLLDPSQRSPHEEFQYSNYPEVAELEPKLNDLFTYLEFVTSAVSAFQENEADKIYLNVAEIDRKLDLIYEICDVLGRADNVCFDILMNVRSVQEILHEIKFAWLSQGDLLVSPVQPPSEEEDVM